MGIWDVWVGLRACGFYSFGVLGSGSWAQPSGFLRLLEPQCVDSTEIMNPRTAFLYRTLGRCSPAHVHEPKEGISENRVSTFCTLHKAAKKQTHTHTHTHSDEASADAVDSRQDRLKHA